MIPVAIRWWRLMRRQRRLRGEATPSTGETDAEVARSLDVELTRTKILLGLMVGYYVVVQLGVFLIMGLYLQFSSAGSGVMVKNGQATWWYSLFQAVSSFHNSGLCLLTDSLIQFNTQIMALIFYGALVLMGNSFYPIFLRATLVLLAWLFGLRRHPAAAHFQAILQAPRSYTTHLFPARHTWVLLIVQTCLILLQTMLMCALDNGTPAFAGLNGGYIFANALFQSIMVRASGLTSIPVGMMYLSIYPITIMLRTTNELSNSEQQSASYQLKRLLFQDLLWVFVPWYLVCAIEAFTDYGAGFNALFETVSAYGNVGLSIGVSYANYSFCGSFHTASKLVIIAVMFMGRHRGMPDRFDAVFTSGPRSVEIKTRALPV
jgi:Trk-type K+ transport system membrane component